MKKLLFFAVLFVLINSCSSVKYTQEAINNGNYDQAIAIAVKNLKKNKLKKGNQPYILMLEDAYVKANQRDLEQIDFLNKENNPEKIETIYVLYENLKERQEIIKPLLPLTIVKKNRAANFEFTNYDTQIIAYRSKMTEYLYANAQKLFRANTKFDYRAAYEDLSYIEKVYPNYKDVRNLMNIARERGLDFVIVSVKNETDKVIPKRLEEDLLNFDTYGLNDLWTVYHGKKDAQINYDFGLELNLRSIAVSPEQVREKQIIKEKKVKDGFKYLRDDKGVQVKDSLGNRIKVDNLVNVRCEFYQFTQFKTAKVVGQVKYIDLFTKQNIQIYPIESQFVFEHIYARLNGDKRALEESLLDLLTLKAISFPTNEQMIYDTGTDLKQQLKSIITRNGFRN